MHSWVVCLDENGDGDGGGWEDRGMGMGKFIYVCGRRRGLKTGTITRHGVDGRVKVRLFRMMVLKMLKMCVV
jgi:hypothetical protein